MFWIMGGEGIIHALGKLTGWGVMVWASKQMMHTEWNGFTFYDMIFPLFLFIAGVSMPFSFDKRLEKGENRSEIYKHIFKRTFLLILFGLIYNGLLDFDFDHLRYASVLARIGLGWCFAALIYMNFSQKAQIIWAFGILIFYWLIMALIPIPGHAAGDFSMEGNLASYIDRLYLPGRLYKVIHDPEGILSTIPAVSTALFGVLTGKFLKSESLNLTRFKKAIYLALAGIIFLGISYLWNIYFPVNKNLWTSSFVFRTAGWSLLLLSFFYMIIDVWGFKKWAFFFIVIGLNPITIYMLQSGIIDFMNPAKYFTTGIINLFPENVHELLWTISYVMASWVFLYILYKKRIFLKV